MPPKAAVSSPDSSEPTQRDPSRAFSSFLRRISQALRRRQADSIRESLEEVIEESERQNPALARRERVMLANLLKFGELRVDDVKVPRADIIAVDESISVCELVAKFREAEHSRLPVYRENLDDPIGLVHIKDVVGLGELGPDGIMRWPDVPISKVRREILVAPPSMPASDLLLKMQTTRIHLALVIDEYGGTDGLVSIEDLVEEIVGDIGDEHDVDEAPHLTQLADGGFEADARLDLDDFTEQTGIALEPPDPEEDIDTLGGLVVSLIGRVPQRGEIVTHGGFEFEVLQADPRRIRRLRLRLPKPPQSVDA
ncbi:MAG: HlyC/CorC family transporter [Alphaproteobacteria bacterium]|nr:HlyC/CorC family transporter [Alphaproteobacteria bacterium]MBV9061939.1 HlyC/CorC family transporter [Alphaproteobacteria bacterium]